VFNRDDTFLLKHPSRPAFGRCEVAASARKHVANLGRRAIAVIRQHLDEDRRAARAVPLRTSLSSS